MSINLFNPINIKFVKIISSLVDPFQASKLSEACCHKLATV